MEITKRQIKALQTASRKIFSSVEERRDWLENNYGVRSFTNLSIDKADELIKKLTRIQTHTSKNGGGSPPPAPSLNRPIGKGKPGSQRHLTLGQAERIRLLGELLRWDFNGLISFIKRQINKNKETVILKSVEMLMNYEAVKVIIGMEKIACVKYGFEYEVLNKMQNSELRDLIDNIKKAEVKSGKG